METEDARVENHWHSAWKRIFQKVLCLAFWTKACSPGNVISSTENDLPG